jgi:DNA repair protein SbcC/Rad50
MLTKLSYSVTFPTTGRTIAGEFDFKSGFGVITGANEQGKSLIIEVVRWCLFGSAALGGKAEDYKTLRTTLEFSARGQSYVGIGPTRRQGDAVLCSGTTPVNKHIPALLGFGLDVFDVACAANQGRAPSLLEPTGCREPSAHNLSLPATGRRPIRLASCYLM